METGRVINRRYLLQRRIKQGQVCVAYQGIDQVLQRVVAVKTVPAEHAPAYRAAIKMTAHFSHPNVVGLYDLITEHDTLYIVQEYVEGDDFASLLQAQLSPYDVADLGSQICEALVYAGSSLRRVCHGDLLPGAIIRDRSGLVRVNNFALPSDLYYFQNWCTMGGDGIAVSDTDLPWGQQSEARSDDDTRAVGLLLYQLLTGRPAGAKVVEPPPDGKLRFQRTVPPELCETVARAIVRKHPQHTNTPEALYADLKVLVDALEPPLPVPALISSTYAREEPLVISQYSPAGAGKLATALPVRETEHPGQSFSPYRSEQSLVLPPPEAAGPPSVAGPPAISPTTADVSLKLAAARRAAYPEPQAIRKAGPSAPMILLLGLIAFIVLFIVGYFGGQLLFH